MTRVAIFIDYQNVYRRARTVFDLGTGPSWMGQIDPYAVGRELAGRGPRGHDRHLSAVRVYRGIPDSHMDTRAFAASRRQAAFWRTLPEVQPVLRALQYIKTPT